MRMDKKNVNEILFDYGMKLDSIRKKVCWRKKYRAVYINTLQIYVEADTLQELMNLFIEKKRFERGDIL